MDFEEKTIASEKKFAGKIIDLYVETVALPNGKTAKREIVKHAGAVAIMAFTSANKMIFVKQYRKPLNRITLEIPAGKIDPEDQTTMETAVRELEEETQLSGQLTPVVSFYSSPGFADELLHIYRADQLKVATDPRPQDDDELIEIFELSLSEAEEALQNGLICDAKTIYALEYWKNQSREK